MGFQIESSDNTPYGVIVNKDGRLLSEATNVSLLQDASGKGNAFCLDTGFISLTAASGYSGVLYFRNTSLRHLHISNICLSGEAIQKWKVYKSPSTGTLISGAVDAIKENVNFSSGTVFQGDAFKGADGNTITDGTVFVQFITNIGSQWINLDSSVMMGQNDSLAVDCKPSSDGEIAVVFLCYFED